MKIKIYCKNKYKKEQFGKVYWLCKIEKNKVSCPFDMHHLRWGGFKVKCSQFHKCTCVDWITYCIHYNIIKYIIKGNIK